MTVSGKVSSTGSSLRTSTREGSRHGFEWAVTITTGHKGPWDICYQNNIGA
tara:strand:+ start:506 stop:658 length:153 start_codon:yes stop_codon:yes gene_type:complete